MKLYLLISGMFLLLLACESSKKDEVRQFIPGTYARFSDHEMRREYDTIKIEVISETGNNYSLIRSSSFQRKLDGKEFPWEYIKEKWIAVYNEDRRVLYESRKGKVISFVPDKGMLLVGATEYKKLK